MPTDTDYARVVVISADVRSIIEEPSKINEWAKSISDEVREQKAAFAAIHLQGLLAKNKNGKEAIDRLMHEIDARPGFEQFQSSRHFHDVEGSGLSSLYYARDVARPALFSYKNNEYWPVSGHGASDASNVKREKLQSSSTGLIESSQPSVAITRWLLFDKPFNFINLALTSETSPLDGCERWPSNISMERSQQLKHIVNSLQGQNLWDEDATFLAGNFNASLNKSQILQDQSRNNHGTLINKLADSSAPRLEALNFSGKKIIHVNEKKFDLLDLHDWMFNTCKGQLVKKYDQELSDFKNNNLLHEPKIYFAPNFPCGFDKKAQKDYFERSQCPSWSNRVLVNPKAWQMMHRDSFSGSGLYYGIVGQNIDIGEYKPISMFSTVCLKK